MARISYGSPRRKPGFATFQAQLGTGARFAGGLTSTFRAQGLIGRDHSVVAHAPGKGYTGGGPSANVSTGGQGAGAGGASVGGQNKPPKLTPIQRQHQRFVNILDRGDTLSRAQHRKLFRMRRIGKSTTYNRK